MSNQQIKHDGDPKKYFVMLPNLVDDSDLNPFEFRLYVHYCRVGNCWEATKTTARKCGMGVGTVSKHRKSLAKKGWIILTEPDQSNPFDTVKIKVVDKWTENMAAFANLTNEQTRSLDESPPSLDESPPSLDESKNNQANKNQAKKQPAAVAAYEQTFGPIANRVQSDLLADDIETYGETAVIEAIKAAAEAGARTYKWASARLKGRATDGTKKAAASSVWDNEIEPYMHHKKRWPDVSPKAQQIIKSIGGQSRLRETKMGFEMDQLKREVMAHV